MIELSTKSSEHGAPTALQSAGSTGTVFGIQINDCCPGCGSSDIRFGSRDPCEGDYYHCQRCGENILFPLNYVRKFIQPIIDSDIANESILMVKRLHSRQARS